MKLLLEFNPEDIIKVFKPFFSKPETQQFLKDNKFQSFSELVDVTIKKVNENLSYYLSWKDVGEFIQMPRDLRGTYAIKLFSIMKHDVEKMLKGDRQYYSWRWYYHSYLIQVGVVYLLYSYMTAKKIFVSLPQSIQDDFTATINAKSLKAANDSAFILITDVEKMAIVKDTIYMFHIKKLISPIYEDAKYAVYKVDTYKEACIVGGNARWCVSSSSGESHMKTYKDKKLVLYAILDKKLPHRKFLLALPELQRLNEFAEFYNKIKNPSSKRDAIIMLVNEIMANHWIDYAEYEVVNTIKDYRTKHRKFFRSIQETYEFLTNIVNKPFPFAKWNAMLFKSYNRAVLDDLQREAIYNWDNYTVFRMRDIFINILEISYRASIEFLYNEYSVMNSLDYVSFINQNVNNSPVSRWDNHLPYRKRVIQIIKSKFDSFDKYANYILTTFQSLVSRRFPAVSYEFANINNEHLKLQDEPEIFETYKKALPEYHIFFQLLEKPNITVAIQELLLLNLPIVREIQSLIIKYIEEGKDNAPEFPFISTMMKKIREAESDPEIQEYDKEAMQGENWMQEIREILNQKDNPIVRLILFMREFMQIKTIDAASQIDTINVARILDPLIDKKTHIDIVKNYLSTPFSEKFRDRTYNANNILRIASSPYFMPDLRQPENQIFVMVLYECIMFKGMKFVAEIDSEIKSLVNDSIEQLEKELNAYLAGI